MTESRDRQMRVTRVGGIDVLVTPSWAIGTVLLVLLFSAIGHFVFHHGYLVALGGGAALALAHWVSEVVHNLGHNVAARSTGHPMTATRLGFLLVLAASIYPLDEPELPPRVHIRRAFGGPAGSAVLTVALGFAALVLAPTRVGWLALVWFLDNLLVFTLGAFLPLGFNDGSTLIRWIRHRHGDGDPDATEVEVTGPTA